MRILRPRYLIPLVLLLTLTLVIASCTKTTSTPADEPEAAAPKPTMTTVEFKVEMPATATPTVVIKDGVAQPTNTPGPTNTTYPTKTPRPTEAPTSAPIDDPNMVYIPGGEYVIGTGDGRPDESPQQTVQVKPYNIDINPVTCADYAAFVEETGHRTPRDWEDGQVPEGRENHPVIWVTWDDASAYAEWAGKRLPTEFEWEIAARGTAGNLYPYGNSFDTAKCNSNQSGVKGTSPVDQYPDGASEFGAMDMSGNVWEWTADWYTAYRGSLFGSERFGDTYKVLRGGSWFDDAETLRAVTRNSAKPAFKFSTIGFRCVK